MASLLSERDSLELRLESAVRLQSPVHRLPSELLASIFTTCIMTMEEEDSLMLSTIMLVCRHWRDVALNTPIVWSRIVAGTHHPLSKAFCKLERSKSIPLHICVDFSPRVENGTVTTESIVRTMDLLRTSVWRWKTFRLTVPNRPQAHAALMRCKDPAPLLEVLSIRVLHSMQEDVYHANPPRAIFEGQAPSLTSCSMTSFNFGWDMHLVSHLRVLKLGGYWNGYAPSMDTTLAIIRASPYLEELTLRNMSDVDSGSCPEVDDYDDLQVHVSDTRMIHLPRLTKASFYYSGTLRTRTIFGLLSCPALETVELCFLDNVSPIIEHLRRQSLTRLALRHLRIETCFFSELKLARFLQRVPSLTTLELVDVDDVSPSLLKVRPSHYTCFPCLTSCSRISRLQRRRRHGSARSSLLLAWKGARRWIGRPYAPSLKLDFRRTRGLTRNHYLRQVLARRVVTRLHHKQLNALLSPRLPPPLSLLLRIFSLIPPPLRSRRLDLRTYPNACSRLT